VLDQHHAFPQEVDAPAPGGAQQVADGAFEAADAAGVQAEGVEEVLPKGLRVGPFAAGGAIFGDEALGALPDFVNRQNRNEGEKITAQLIP
jgi:hypothetical protein